MANLDVTDLLADPDTCDPFQVIRRPSVIGADGRTTITPTAPIECYGSVQPASGRTLQLMPDLANVDGVIEIYTTAALQTDTANFKADIVMWNCEAYVVNGMISSWQNFGYGFGRYIATLFDQTGGIPP
jgi:hypothetical protein